MAAKSIKLAQGGLIFEIRANHRCAWITQELGRRWRSFATEAAPVDVDVRITCYDARNTFHWPVVSREPFKRIFAKVGDRFPYFSGNPGAASRPEKILSRLDPVSRIMKLVATRLQEDGRVIFANTATGLFFFLPVERKLYIFSRAVPPPFPLFSRIYSKPSQGRSALVADITNGIMLAFSWLLVRDGGLLLHGTGLSKSGQALLFLGLSGAGKSTVARNCPAEVCFSDDGVIVRRTARGAVLYPSFFTQVTGHWRHPQPRPVVLRKLFLLRKSDIDQVLPLDKSHLMNHILLHLIHFFRYFDNETAKKAFNNTLAVVAALPAYRLDFTKKRKDWSDIWQAPETRKSTSLRS